MSLEIIRNRKYLLDNAMKTIYAMEVNDMILAKEKENIPSLTHCLEYISEKFDDNLFEQLISLIRTIKGHEKFMLMPSNARVIEDMDVLEPMSAVELTEHFFRKANKEGT